jgi:hypothetical protein
MDALRPNARLQLAARSAADAAQLASIAADRDRSCCENGPVARPGRGGGPRAIGEALSQLFAIRALDESASAAERLSGTDGVSVNNWAFSDPRQRRSAPVECGIAVSELAIIVS